MHPSSQRSCGFQWVLIMITFHMAMHTMSLSKVEMNTSMFSGEMVWLDPTSRTSLSQTKENTTGRMESWVTITFFISTFSFCFRAATLLKNILKRRRNRVSISYFIDMELVVDIIRSLHKSAQMEGSYLKIREVLYDWIISIIRGFQQILSFTPDLFFHSLRGRSFTVYLLQGQIIQHTWWWHLA